MDGMAHTMSASVCAAMIARGLQVAMSALLEAAFQEKHGQLRKILARERHGEGTKPSDPALDSVPSCLRMVFDRRNDVGDPAPFLGTAIFDSKMVLFHHVP